MRIFNRFALPVINANRSPNRASDSGRPPDWTDGRSMIEGRPVIRECGSYSIQSVGHGGAVWLFSPPMQPTVGDAKRTNLQIDVVKVSIRGGRPSKLCKLHLKAPGGSFAKLTRNINGDHGDIGRGGAALFTGRHTAPTAMQISRRRRIAIGGNWNSPTCLPRYRSALKHNR